MKKIKSMLYLTNEQYLSLGFNNATSKYWIDEDGNMHNIWEDD